MSLTVNNGSIFEDINGLGIQVIAGNAAGSTGTINLVVEDSTFRNSSGSPSHGGLEMNVHDNSTLNFRVGGPTVAQGNTFENLSPLSVSAGATQLLLGGSSQAAGSWQYNTFDNIQGRDPIRVSMDANAAGLNLLVDNNTITDTTKDAIKIDLNTTNAAADIDIEITNNTLGSTTAGDEIDDSAVDLSLRGGSGSGKVLISGNTMINNSSSVANQTINVTAEDNMTLDLTIKDNPTIRNLNASGGEGRIRTRDAGSTMNLNVDANDIDGGSGVFNLDTVAGSTMNVEQLPTLGTRNGGATFNQTGGGTYNNVPAGTVDLPTVP
jgi:hypothetical protein